MLYYARGSETEVLSASDLKMAVCGVLEELGPKKRVLAVPPDFTRYHSRAGLLTSALSDYYGDVLQDVLPALGTHTPMTDKQIRTMFPGVPKEKFRIHDWREGVVELGRLPASYVEEVSEGAVAYDFPAEVAELVAHGGHDLIFSPGQVVPHEVIGMANYTKNIFVGTGGSEGINKSHFIGAAYGMERIMGRADNPVRKVLDEVAKRFAAHLPILYALTVVGRDDQGALCTRGLFVGDDAECFQRAAALSQKVNIQLLERPLDRVLVYLDPGEFKSTWLGNKAIYRTRMALADDAELLILAPAVEAFGEDARVDALIRKHGYRTTPEVLAAVASDPELAANLGAAAHLIHGSSEGRFRITYAAGGLSRQEIESAGFAYADVDAMLNRYCPETLQDGFVNQGSESFFYISNPATGLWATRDRF